MRTMHPGLTLTIVAGLALTLTATGRAQEQAGAPTPDAAAPAPAAAPAQGESLEQKIEALRQEMAQMRAELDEERSGERRPLSGWQLQLRGGWFNLAHNHRNNVFSADDHQNGWELGVGLIMPVWEDLGPVDLLGHMVIDYRQTGYSTTYTAPITGDKGTISYLNVIVAPMVRFEATEVVRPFVLAGLNMQVASPPQDPISYLDLGLTVGLGIDFKVHERVSVGMDYKYTWFGVADQEDEDYGTLGGYIGLNF